MESDKGKKWVCIARTGPRAAGARKWARCQMHRGIGEQLGVEQQLCDVPRECTDAVERSGVGRKQR